MNTSTEISFIDGNLNGIDTLIAGLASDTQYVILDPTQDGIAQIAGVLNGGLPIGESALQFSR